MFISTCCNQTDRSVRTLAIIGASYLQLPLVKKAKEMRLRVICFAWREGAVCADEADVFYPVSIVEKDEILTICRKERIDGICTIASDVAAPTVAYVAEKMGLIGNSFSASVIANNKFLMREAFCKAAIPCPRFKRVTSPDEVKSENWEFPLIVKPCDRSGSLGVRIITDISCLVQSVEDAIALSFKKEAIIEQYIEGREISVEFISYNGRHFPLSITDKVTTGAPHFVELEHHEPAQLDQEQYNKLYSLTSRALDALGVTNGASHTEYKITEDGKVFIIELGARMGGDFIGSDLVQLSTGYDFVKGVIQVALGEFMEPDVKQKCSSGVFFLCKETERLLPFFQKKRSLPCITRMEMGSPVLKSVTCSADRSGYMIYQSNGKVVI
ncbi:MAG: ATP-grasp domain-containing protein [Bacteroidales bacterium]|nr:ATP-grasp domain-containing protein [Bacteroidales bacterium]